MGPVVIVHCRQVLETIDEVKVVAFLAVWQLWTATLGNFHI
jgi:hypothetical protein